MDRNATTLLVYLALIRSLSARRAWIEIRTPHHRNTRPMPSLSARRAWIEIGAKAEKTQYQAGSLSARRAWIEILSDTSDVKAATGVALRKESVDRNDEMSSKEIFRP